MKHIVRLLPEYIKLDLFLIRDIHKDPVKRAVVAGMVGVAAQIGGRVIAEGVETAEELRALAELGIDWAQGYYLGRPGPLPSRLITDHFANRRFFGAVRPSFWATEADQQAK